MGEAKRATSASVELADVATEYLMLCCYRELRRAYLLTFFQ